MRNRGVRLVFRVLALLVLVVSAVALTVYFVFPNSQKTLPKPEACAVVSNVIDAIVTSFSPSSADVQRLDVRKMSVADFAAAIEHASSAATLWTPGEGDWLILGATRGASNRLDRVIERFAEAETPFSLPEIFANCVGTLAEVRPAFAGLNPNEGVVPELFVTKEIPAWTWLDTTDVETNALGHILAEMRSMQVVRRVVLEGNIASRKGDVAKSVEAWSRARLRNPNDTLLLERVSHLRSNAEVFYKLGKFGMAGNCYETLVGIDPNDRAAKARLALCFRNLGKTQEARAIEETLKCPKK